MPFPGSAFEVLIATLAWKFSSTFSLLLYTVITFLALFGFAGFIKIFSHELGV